MAMGPTDEYHTQVKQPFPPKLNSYFPPDFPPGITAVMCFYPGKSGYYVQTNSAILFELTG